MIADNQDKWFKRQKYQRRVPVKSNEEVSQIFYLLLEPGPQLLAECDIPSFWTHRTFTRPGNEVFTVEIYRLW